MYKNYLTKTGKLSKSQPQEIRNQWYTEKCNAVHCSKYDYSDTIFLKTRDIICISCPDHGIFTQKLSQHLEGEVAPTAITTTD